MNYVIFIISGLISFVVTYFVQKYGRLLKIIDDPKTHIHPKVVHSTPVPRGGGLPIIICLLLLAWFALPHTIQSLGIVLASLLVVGIGLADDRFEELISPYTRLIFNILASLIVIACGIRIEYITNPFVEGAVIIFPYWLSVIGTTIWLVAMQNIVGWSTGVDGQMPGFVGIAAITMGILGTQFAPDKNQVMLIGLSLITSGAFFGFLPWNWYPQKIMPGYSGKSLAGFLLGILAIVSSAKIGAMIMILSIPFIDALRLIVKRLSEGKSPVWGDRQHLHHYLLDSGWGKRRIAMFYLLTSLIFACVALNLNSSTKYFTIAGILVACLLFIICFQYLSIFSKRPDQDNGSRI